MRGRILSLAVPLLLSGCSDIFGGGDCPAMIYPSVQIYVRDDVTGDWAAAGATGSVQDGAYADELRVNSWQGDTPVALATAESRAGIYTVRVERPGYQPWIRQNVRVRRNSCGVETTTLQARLTPIP